MSRNYKFYNPEVLYFVSFAVVEWLDVFTRNEYKDILLQSLSYCQKEKGMEIIAWCIMTNHVHLVFRSVKGQHPSLLLGDFKWFTSKAVVKAIQENPRESRKEFLMEQFKIAAAKSSNVKKYQFWRHDNMITSLSNFGATRLFGRRSVMSTIIPSRLDWFIELRIMFIAVLWIMRMKKDYWMIL